MKHPDYGRVVHDIHGKIVCHVCGRSYRQLTNTHLNGHDLTADEYKERFGLNRKTALMSLETHAWYQANAGSPDLVLVRPKDSRRRPGGPERAQGRAVRLAALRSPEHRRRLSERQSKPHPCPACGTMVPTASPLHCSDCVSRSKIAKRRPRGEYGKFAPNNT